jgi:hypothetical protein
MGNFDLAEIWRTQDLDDALVQFFKDLMLLVNGLIKKYSASDDYNEYCKKPELWDAIKSSSEISAFTSNAQNAALIKKFSR